MSTVYPGSSPHTRGAHVCGEYVDICHGIIPAYAGSTLLRDHLQALPGDHPRIRGEHDKPEPFEHVIQGSSPHTRGAHACVESRARFAGIIPAYAGSTWRATPGSSRTRDHPRIRGEHHSSFARVLRVMGSSPHTRGALLRNTKDGASGGIIPAYAGSTVCDVHT